MRPIVLDFDDFREGNERWEMLLYLKKKLPLLKVTLFTIVGECSPEWLEEKKKVEWIDMVPHGWLHPDPRECETWTYEESIAYLDRIEPLGLTKGFKAPGWQISDGMYQALLERGYWVADQHYNDERRPKELPVYHIENGQYMSVHGHIGHLGWHNVNEIEYLVPMIENFSASQEFIFVKELF